MKKARDAVYITKDFQFSDSEDVLFSRHKDVLIEIIMRVPNLKQFLGRFEQAGSKAQNFVYSRRLWDLAVKRDYTEQYWANYDEESTPSNMQLATRIVVDSYTPKENKHNESTYWKRLYEYMARPWPEIELNLTRGTLILDEHISSILTSFNVIYAYHYKHNSDLFYCHLFDGSYVVPFGPNFVIDFIKRKCYLVYDKEPPYYLLSVSGNRLSNPYYPDVNPNANLIFKHLSHDGLCYNVLNLSKQRFTTVKRKQDFELASCEAKLRIAKKYK